MPEVTVATALFFGFALGVKHALDADHIVAITTIVSRTSSFLHSLIIGLSWGIGHTFTLLLAGIVVLVFKAAIPEKVFLSMEFLVGIFLVLLGVPLIKQLIVARPHIHIHKHGTKSHVHPHSHQETEKHKHRHIRRPLLLGMIHGMAGSGAVLLLVLSTMPTVGQGLIYIMLFGIGTIVGMVLFSGLIGLPFRFAGRYSYKLQLWFKGAAGLLSVFLGSAIMWQVATSGLFVSGV